jgi:hypothetical protein
MKLIQKLKDFFKKIKKKREIAKRMKELRKRDPFIY